MKFLTFLKSNGKIVSVIDAPEDTKPLYVLDDIDVLDCDKNAREVLNTYYIIDNEIVLRPTQMTSLDKLTIFADGADMVIITNAPEGIFTAKNKTTGEEVSGDIVGSDTFSTTVPGTYKITITAFPFLDFTTTIEAI